MILHGQGRRLGCGLKRGRRRRLRKHRGGRVRVLSGEEPLCRRQMVVPAYCWTKLFTGSGRSNQGKVVKRRTGAPGVRCGPLKGLLALALAEVGGGEGGMRMGTLVIATSVGFCPL